MAIKSETLKIYYNIYCHAKIESKMFTLLPFQGEIASTRRKCVR